MRPRHLLLATALMAGTLSPATAQTPDPEPRSERRPWIRLEPFYRRPSTDFNRFRFTPDRMRVVERSLERAQRARMQAVERARGHLDRVDRLRIQSRDRALDRLDRVRDREFALRDRLSDRLSDRFQENLRRERVTRERIMDRIRDRMDGWQDGRHFTIRRRARTI